MTHCRISDHLSLALETNRKKTRKFSCWLEELVDTVLAPLQSEIISFQPGENEVVDDVQDFPIVLSLERNVHIESLRMALAEGNSPRRWLILYHQSSHSEEKDQCFGAAVNRTMKGRR